MWKYINENDIKEFLLSICLLKNNISDKDKIKKLYSISNNTLKNYKIFKIRKRNGKFRTIYNPNYSLKYIQKQILNNILNNKSISKYAKAYHKNISLKDNASPHINKKIVLKLDVKNFFEIINFYTVYETCFPLEYFPESIGMLLTYLCTYRDYLPQGAPTSSYISNLVLKDFDDELGNWCLKNNIAYTRYSDDMTFSGDFAPKEIIIKVKKMLSKLGFELNEKKTHVISNNNRQQVTGIVVNKKPQFSNTFRKKIRQEIYYIRKFGLDSHLKRINCNIEKDKYLNSLYGKVLFVLQINEDDKEFIDYRYYLTSLKSN